MDNCGPKHKYARQNIKSQLMKVGAIDEFNNITDYKAFLGISGHLHNHLNRQYGLSGSDAKLFFTERGATKLLFNEDLMTALDFFNGNFYRTKTNPNRYLDRMVDPDASAMMETMNNIVDPHHLVTHINNLINYLENAKLDFERKLTQVKGNREQSKYIYSRIKKIDEQINGDPERGIKGLKDRRTEARGEVADEFDMLERYAEQDLAYMQDVIDNQDFYRYPEVQMLLDYYNSFTHWNYYGEYNNIPFHPLIKTGRSTDVALANHLSNEQKEKLTKIGSRFNTMRSVMDHMSRAASIAQIEALPQFQGFYGDARWGLKATVEEHLNDQLENDIGIFSKYFLDIANSFAPDNPNADVFGQAMLLSLLNTVEEYALTANGIKEQLINMAPKVHKALTNTRFNDKYLMRNKLILAAVSNAVSYSIFWQHHKSGFMSGRLTNKWSSEFMAWEDTIEDDMVSDLQRLEAAVSEPEARANVRKAHYDRMRNRIKEKAEFVDLRYITDLLGLKFDYTPGFTEGSRVEQIMGELFERPSYELYLEDAEAYTTRLKEKLGQRGYDELVKEQLEMVDKYIMDFELFIENTLEAMHVDSIDDLVGIQKDTFTAKVQGWDRRNNPFHFNSIEDMRTNAEVAEGEYHTMKYNRFFPRENSDLDEQFTEIQQNDDLYEFLDLAKQAFALVQHAMPYDMQESLQEDVIFTVEKQLIEAMLDPSFTFSAFAHLGINRVLDRVISYTSLSPKPQNSHARVNLVTRQEETVIDPGYTKRNEGRINAFSQVYSGEFARELNHPAYQKIDTVSDPGKSIIPFSAIRGNINSRTDPNSTEAVNAEAAFDYLLNKISQAEKTKRVMMREYTMRMQNANDTQNIASRLDEKEAILRDALSLPDTATAFPIGRFLRDAATHNIVMNESWDLPMLMSYYADVASLYAARTAAKPKVDAIFAHYKRISQPKMNEHQQNILNVNLKGVPTDPKGRPNAIGKYTNWYERVLLNDYYIGDRIKLDNVATQRMTKWFQDKLGTDTAIGRQIRKIRLGISEMPAEYWDKPLHKHNRGQVLLSDQRALRKMLEKEAVAIAKYAGSNEAAAEGMRQLLDKVKDVEGRIPSFQMFFLSAVLDVAKYRGIAWAPAAAMTNFVEGQLSNFIMAEIGDYYDKQDFLWAMSVLKGSIYRNWVPATIPGAQYIPVVGDIAPNLNLHHDAIVGYANLARVLMDRWSILQDSSNLFERATTKTALHKMTWAGPFEIVRRIEYLNQVPIMLSVLKGTKVTGVHIAGLKALSAEEVGSNQLYQAIQALDENTDFVGDEILNFAKRKMLLVTSNVIDVMDFNGRIKGAFRTGHNIYNWELPTPRQQEQLNRMGYNRHEQFRVMSHIRKTIVASHGDYHSLRGMMAQQGAMRAVMMFLKWMPRMVHARLNHRHHDIEILHKKELSQKSIEMLVDRYMSPVYRKLPDGTYLKDEVKIFQLYELRKSIVQYYGEQGEIEKVPEVLQSGQLEDEQAMRAAITWVINGAFLSTDPVNEREFVTITDEHSLIRKSIADDYVRMRRERVRTFKGRFNSYQGFLAWTAGATLGVSMIQTMPLTASLAAGTMIAAMFTAGKTFKDMNAGEGHWTKVFGMHSVVNTFNTLVKTMGWPINMALAMISPAQLKYNRQLLPEGINTDRLINENYTERDRDNNEGNALEMMLAMAILAGAYAVSKSDDDDDLPAWSQKARLRNMYHNQLMKVLTQMGTYTDPDLTEQVSTASRIAALSVLKGIFEVGAGMATGDQSKRRKGMSRLLPTVFQGTSPLLKKTWNNVARRNLYHVAPRVFGVKGSSGYLKPEKIPWKSGIAPFGMETMMKRKWFRDPFTDVFLSDDERMRKRRKMLKATEKDDITLMLRPVIEKIHEDVDRMVEIYYAKELAGARTARKREQMKRRFALGDEDAEVFLENGRLVFANRAFFYKRLADSLEDIVANKYPLIDNFWYDDDGDFDATSAYRAIFQDEQAGLLGPLPAHVEAGYEKWKQDTSQAGIHPFEGYYSSRTYHLPHQGETFEQYMTRMDDRHESARRVAKHLDFQTDFERERTTTVTSEYMLNKMKGEFLEDMKAEGVNTTGWDTATEQINFYNWLGQIYPELAQALNGQ